MVDSFIADLFCLAKHCGYRAPHNEMVQDQIVVGILHSPLSERMQLDPKLTLKKAVDHARQSEAVKKQQATVHGDKRDKPSIEAVRVRKSYQKLRQRKFKPVPQPQVCTRCGSHPHTMYLNTQQRSCLSLMWEEGPLLISV